MALDNTALNQEEIDFLAQATLSARIANRGEVVNLDHVESGILKFAMRAPRISARRSRAASASSSRATAARRSSGGRARTS